MTKRLVALGALLTLLGSVGIARADETFKATLTGDQEVPPVTDQGTTGRFKIQFNKGLTTGEYTLRVDSGIRVTQAHLHCGVDGVNGPIIVFLAGFHAPGWDVDGKWVSEATVTNANVVNLLCGATLADIADAARNGRVYVNVHSVAKPGGVARGQLEPTSEE